MQISAPTNPTNLAQPQDGELRTRFNQFVGQSMFGQMLKSMRKSVGEPAYFHGGRGEEVFQSQLDQLLVEKISDASSSQLADPMYERFASGMENRQSISELPELDGQSAGPSLESQLHSAQRQADQANKNSAAIEASRLDISI